MNRYSVLWLIQSHFKVQAYSLLNTCMFTVYLSNDDLKSSLATDLVSLVSAYLPLSLKLCAANNWVGQSNLAVIRKRF